MARIQRPDYINASEVGQAKFCPHSVSLARRGILPSKVSLGKMDAGTKSHEEFTAQELKRDSRCFVATHLYGETHWKTELLRTFRDQCLGRTMPGKITIKAYYWLSPYLVSLARRMPVLDRVLNPIIDKVVSWCISKLR